MTNGAEAVLVTSGDRLLGIVTTSDLIRSLAAMPRTKASAHSAALTPG
jgi:CBS domain-containing protein